jgi:hypothetical protein
MSLVTRTVTGTLLNAADKLLSRRAFWFKAAAVFGASGVVVATLPRVDLVTAENGTFTVDLYTVDTVDAFIRYTGELPEGEAITFDLEDGAATTLDELLNLGSLGNADLTAAMVAMQDIVDNALQSHDPDAPPASPHAFDDNFLGTTLDAAWTISSQEQWTRTISKSILKGVVTVDGKFCGLSKAVANLNTTDWALVCKVAVNYNPLAFLTTDDIRAGIWVNQTDGSSTIKRFIAMGNEMIYCGNQITSAPTVDFGLRWEETSRVPNFSWGYLKIVRDNGGPKYDYYASYDGVIWMPLLSYQGQDFAPTAIGVMAYAIDVTDPRHAYFDWVRFYSGGDPGIVGG